MKLIPLSALFEAKKEGRAELRTKDSSDRSASRVLREPKKPPAPKPPKDRNGEDAVQKRMDAQERRKKTIAEKQKKERAQAAETNKNARQARAAAIRAKGAPKEPPGIKTVPAQIAHCMMAVHLKRGKSKRAAWNICRASMTKYGYLKGPYRRGDKLPDTVKPTAKGVRRNFQHGMEKGPLNRGVAGTGSSKFKKFVKLFKDFERHMLPKEKKAVE